MAQRAERIDRVALSVLTRHPTCCTLRLAEATGIPHRSLANAVEGISPMPVTSLRRVLTAMVARGAEEDALALVSEILDLRALGWELRHSARPAPAASLTAAGLHAAGAVGEAVGEIAEAAADGQITAVEAERLDGPVAHALHQLGRFRAFLRGAPVGQASLPGLGR